MANKILTQQEWMKSLANDFSVAVEATCREQIEAAVAAEREACHSVCYDEAMRCAQAAQQCDADGESDEAISLRATAWKINVCAQAIRARGEK